MLGAAAGLVLPWHFLRPLAPLPAAWCLVPAACCLLPAPGCPHEAPGRSRLGTQASGRELPECGRPGAAAGLVLQQDWLRTAAGLVLQ